METRRFLPAAWLCLVGLGSGLGEEPAVELERKEHDPYGFPRPGPSQEGVPLRSSLYFELAVRGGAAGDAVDPDSVRVSVRPEGGEPETLLEPGRKFAAGSSGRFFERADGRGKRSLGVWIDPGAPLRPLTRYAVEASAASRKGARTREGCGWEFRTEGPPETVEARFALDLGQPPVRWRGGFFRGFCKASFATSASNMIPTYELMERVRSRWPEAWSIQRDFWMTGTEHRPTFLSQNLPNIVRELETRRIAAIDRLPGRTALRVEDFFGHRQYKIPSGRPPSEDYRPGDAVLVADGLSDARTRVVEVDDRARTVFVEDFPDPPGGWRIAYEGPLPEREDPAAPGLFPPGGLYLRKLDPPGTPRYYFGRLDREFDIAWSRFRRRLVPNFCDAPGDLAADGRAWTRPKDAVEYHDAVRAISGHLIERYGEACLEFYWSVFNEPDLVGFFWRSDWEEAQRFYDVTVDAVLRAFEDAGYDSDRVLVGGFELGAIFGTNLRLEEFLEHCSPRASGRKSLRENAAFADRRLDGRRSRRVERLCAAHGGRGSPCDFVSIHAYNRAERMAAKLIRAKRLALEIDPETYAALRIHSHESCPDWNPPPDPAAADSYLGNGYFPTWCADVSRRLLAQAALDPRYAAGEELITFWPWPNTNFEGANAATRTIHADGDGDGRADRTVTVAMPILHFLGFLGGMGGEFWPLEERVFGRHTVSGFAGRAGGALAILVYSHDPLDPESRSGRSFDVRVAASRFPEGRAKAVEYAFDRDRNSYFELGRRLREQCLGAAATGAPFRPPCSYPAAVVREVERLSELAPTRAFAVDGPAFEIRARLGANAASVVLIEPPAGEGPAAPPPPPGG